MLKIAHLYAEKGGTNCGDFMLGDCTKYYVQNILKKEIKWQTINVREPVTEALVKRFNTYDCLVVGGGGLMLPDSNPNKKSCWQWAISTDLLKKITSKIYVIGIGWNLFTGQTVAMSTRENNHKDPTRVKIFTDNMNTLISKSERFVVRHRGDIERLTEVIGKNDKIEFDYCPVYYYVRDKYSSHKRSPEFYTFEIKQDREWRRYDGTTKAKFFQTLGKFAKELIKAGEKIAIMRHEGGQVNFENFLKKERIPYKLLDNSTGSETQIINNFSKVKKLYCTAGHSQIISEGMGVPYFSFIGHDKLKYFLDDLGKSTDYAYNKDVDLFNKLTDSRL